MTLSETKSIVIIEDDVHVASQLQAFINASDMFSCMQVLHTFHAGKNFLSSNSPDILLVDINLPDGSGIDLIRFVTTTHHQTESLVLSLYGDEGHVIEAIEAGSAGYLLKDGNYEDVIYALHELVKGGAPISPMIARSLLTHFASIPKPQKEPIHQVQLTKKEHEILVYFSKGFNRIEISNYLGVSINTVGGHAKNIYKKFAVHSQGEAVFEAVQQGLIQLD